MKSTGKGAAAIIAGTIYAAAADVEVTGHGDLGWTTTETAVLNTPIIAARMKVTGHADVRIDTTRR